MLKFFNIPTDKDDPDAFQKRMDDEDLPKTPQNDRKGNKSVGNDNNSPKPPEAAKNDSGANDKATKVQIKEVFALAKEKKSDMFAYVDDMAEDGKISTKWPYADKEKTKINWTQADILALMTDLELPF